MFFVCWAPFHAQRLLYIYAQESDYYPDLNEWLYILSGCLYYFSTTVNPILYNLMSIKYRQAFKQTICRKAKQPTSSILTDKDSHHCRCDSTNVVHDRSVVCFVKYNIFMVDTVENLFLYYNTSLCRSANRFQIWNDFSIFRTFCGCYRDFMCLISSL